MDPFGSYLVGHPKDPKTGFLSMELLCFSDMIAIPDFAAGAMENWGLITYRETAMLYQPGVSSEGNKQRVAVVVSHELAHQVSLQEYL